MSYVGAHVTGREYGNPANSNYLIEVSGSGPEAEEDLHQLFEARRRASEGSGKTVLMGRVVLIDVASDPPDEEFGRRLAELLRSWIVRHQCIGVALIAVVISRHPLQARIVHVLQTAGPRPLARPDAGGRDLPVFLPGDLLREEDLPASERIGGF